MIRSALVVSILSVTVSGQALAQTTVADGFNVNRFSPSDRGSEWFTLDSLDLRGHMRPAAGILAELAYKPLVIYDLDENGDRTERVTLVSSQLFLHLGGSLVLKDRVRLGVSLPVVAYQHGTSGEVNGSSYTAPSGAALGDARIGATARVWGKYLDVFTLAVGAQLQLPTGNRDKFDGDGHVRLTGFLAAAGDIGSFAYAARLGMEYRALADSIDGTAIGSEVSLAASAGYRGMERRLLLGVEAWGATVFSDGDSFFKRRTTPFEALVGVHWQQRDWRFGAGVGHGFTAAFGTPAARFLAMVEWAPEPRQEVPPSDRDHDGIFDKEDACPDVPGVRDPDPEKNGCPPIKPDRDHDEIPDDVDACPDIAGQPDPDPAKNGCPPDRDGDGILDLEDACPDVPGVVNPDPAKNGCPPDRDGDGIYDKDDACPDVPGPPNADPKKHGCPPVRIAEGQILILEQVKFKHDSAIILPESDVILTAVAQTMTEHPELTLIEVQGHTDSVGGARYNLGLSNRRAASVVKWLVTHGVAKKRLTSRGFGLRIPVDTNDTPEGRQNNRRVEFHIIGK